MEFLTELVQLAKKIKQDSSAWKEGEMSAWAIKRSPDLHESARQERLDNGCLLIFMIQVALWSANRPRPLFETTQALAKELESVGVHLFVNDGYSAVRLYLYQSVWINVSKPL